jgi:hypothetical protein
MSASTMSPNTPHTNTNSAGTAPTWASSPHGSTPGMPGQHLEQIAILPRTEADSPDRVRWTRRQGLRDLLLYDLEPAGQEGIGLVIGLVAGRPARVSHGTQPGGAV